ncbi:MAG: Mut7-C RNAse domain-containing protein [Gemmatales bacterium]|nr:Mut7-C RNAse domain-containing protein [Gemmatales bacterium]MDW8223134.1 Mut7-C RNAse domain-containing protein [Gemmatales bacterium]
MSAEPKSLGNTPLVASVREGEPRFACDAMLGGLARWLRAWGYDAVWQRDISDWELIRLAQREGRILLTSDSGIFRIGWVRDHDLPALLIPHGLKRHQQLEYVCQQLGLPRKEPRCMRCGGALRPVPKDEVWERIPPKTRLWLDQYYQCQRCGQLFWEGTHWQRIERALNELNAKAAH